MQILPLIFAAALPEPSLPLYHVQDAKGGIEDSWRQVAREQDNRCGIKVTGNGQFFRITMYGFAPGEIGQFQLTNEDIKPVRYRFRSDDAGQFSKIYLPFLWSHDGGTVSLNARGEGCDVSLSFPWRRATLKVH